MSPLEPLTSQSRSLVVAAPTSRKLRQWWQRQVTLTGLAAVLGLSGGWLTAQVIVPLPAQAYTGNVSVAIDVQPSETYETVVRRAEAIARAAAQRSFDKDILVTDVAVMVMAQHEGTTVPILSLTATRSQWRGQPDPRRWATYYSTSKALLGLNSTPTAAATTQPTIQPTTVTPTSPQPTRPFPPTARPAPQSSPDDETDTPGSAAPDTQSPPSSPPPLLPQRIPTPGNIGK